MRLPSAFLGLSLPFPSVVAAVLAFTALATVGSAQTLYVSNGSQINLVSSTETSPTSPDSVLAAGSTETAGMAFDSAGNVYFASGDSTTGIGSVYQVTPGNVVTQYATGLGIVPSGLVFDSNNNLFVSSNTGSGNGNGVIYKVTPSGVVSTFATGLQYAYSMAIDSADNLYVCDLYTTAVRKITPSGSISTFATISDGPAGLCFDSNGNLFVVSPGGEVYKVTSSGVVSTFVSGLNLPYGIAIDPSNNLFVSTYSQTILKVTPGGTVTTFSSTGIAGTESLMAFATQPFVANFGPTPTPSPTPTP